MKILVYNNFVRDPGAMRAAALASEFVDWKGHDGEIYKRVCITTIPGLQDRIEQLLGCKVNMLGMGYRLNFGGEMPNAAIHSDLGWGTHALVLYLSDGDSGTAFWRHKRTGATRIDQGDEDLWDEVRGDWDDPDEWERVQYIPMMLGRGLIYESALFHSRWPFEAFGTGPEDGRLIAVAFFTPYDMEKTR